MSTYYEWSYFDSFTGDGWEGYGFAEDSDGIYDGYQIFTDRGSYTVNYTEYLDYSTGLEGYNQVTWAYDYATGSWGYSYSGSWDGLGTEQGFAYLEDGSMGWFGGTWSSGGFDEVDFSSGNGAGNDIFFEWTYYDDSGDAWAGAGYFDAWEAWAAGDDIWTSNGAYFITYVEDQWQDLGYQGYVYSDWVYDYESDQWGDGTAEGYGGVGTEEGFAYGDDGVSTDWYGGEYSTGGFDPVDFTGGSGTGNDLYIVWNYYDYLSGDWWGGYSYVDDTSGFYAGLSWDTGQGTYTIAESYAVGYDTGWQGYTEVTWTYDAATGEYPTPSAWSWDGFGTEEGTATFADGTVDSFGSEDSLGGYDTIQYSGGGGPLNDLYLIWNYYDYLTGDWWGGYAYVDDTGEFYAGLSWDTGQGVYTVAESYAVGYDTDWQGYTEVTWTYDAATGEYPAPYAWSWDGFGTEEGSATFADGTVDSFGSEDSLGGYDTIQYGGGGGPMDDLYVIWNYYDFDSGDWWGGYAYLDDTGDIWAGLSWENGQGTYTIAEVYAVGYDTDWQGYTEVTWAYDWATGEYPAPYAWSWDGFGTEEGSVDFADGASDWFGSVDSSQGYDTIQHPSDRSGTFDVEYSFTFQDAGGDIYSGRFVADAGDGYAPGQVIAQPYGSYTIGDSVAWGADYAGEGEVWVDRYYDAATEYWGWSNGTGTGGLGSESGNAYWDETLTDMAGWFGYGGQFDANFV